MRANSHRILDLQVAIPLGLAAALATACVDPPARPDPQRLALERERDALRSYLGTDEEAALVPFDDLLVVVREDLVRQVVQAGLPLSTEVGERYVVELSRATVAFRSGLALVELDGRAAWAERPDVYADLQVIGSFQVTGLDRARSTLRARIEILGFETRHVGVRGRSPPVRRLVDGLAAERASELNKILGQLEIPIRLGEEIELPAVEEPEVSIPATTIPIGLEVTDVKVLADRIWVSLAAELGTALRGEPPVTAQHRTPADARTGAPR